jgi:V8-like Glu-specific endopeptidase
MSRRFFPVFRSMLPRAVLALTLLLVCALPTLAASPAYRTYLVSPPDVSKFIAEDGKANQAPYRYGVEVATPGLYLQGGKPSHGVVETLPDGRRVWRVEVVSPGARSLEFAFAKLGLPEGAELFIHSHDRAVSRGPIRAADVQPDGRYFSAFVPGDAVILEVAMASATFADAEIRVANVGHAYRDIFAAARGNKSGSCNVDTICPLGDAWRDQIDAVGHYTLRTGGGTAVCTGTLIANTRGDTTPYFLTANHCLSTEAVADTVVVYWNYQSSTCRAPGSAASGTPLPSSIATHTQSGTALVATSAASDFALLRLDSAVPTAANPFWTGWDVRGDAPPSAVTIHHPAGDEKRISDTIIPLTTSAYLGATGSGTTHWRVADWNNGTTEGGSSGSGLWSPSKQLIGQLHGGFAACGNNEPDWYGRLSVSWNGGGTPTTRLRDWLDPTSSGATTFNGNRATGGGGSMVLGGTADEPSATRVTLPTPNPPNASCPAGFFIATVADGPQAGLTPGAFGMELLLDDPGTRVLAGGLNFGGLIDSGQVGFAAFNIANAANEAQRVNVSLTGSPSSSSTGSLPVRISIARRTATTTDVVYQSTQTISLASAFTTSVDLPPAFYQATVEPVSGTPGGAPEGQFFFSLTTSFVNRPGGGFQGGVVVGGYHAAHPFGGVSGFAAFCLATPHTASMRVLSTPSYGTAGARDLRLQILDAQQAVVVTHPTGGGGNVAPTANFSFTTNGLSASFTDASSDSDGTIASRSWNFGDGGTSTASNPTRTYAAAGTYTVTLTVTDNGGASSTASRSVTVSSGGGGAVQLANNVAVNGSTNSTTPNSSFAEYTVVIPAGASNLVIATTNANADLDLHVRFGQAPTLTTFDCRPFLNGGNESCTFPTPSAGTYFLRVYGFATGVQPFTIRASWTVAAGNALQNGVAVNGSTNSTTPNSSFAEYTVVIPAGASNFNISTSNATGDLDLYVRLGQAPTLTTFDCRPFDSSGNESCTFTSPSAGTYFIRVYGFDTGPQSFTIRATWNAP